MKDPDAVLKVALVGEGLSPDDVPVRQLVELLEATVAAVEAVAREQRLDPPELKLTAVRKGSAAYHLVSTSPSAPAAIRAFYAAAKKRGAASGPLVRHALSRLHGAGKVGAIRVSVPHAKALKPILLAVPVEQARVGYEEAAELHGRIVGLTLQKERLDVFVRPHGGGAVERFPARTDATQKDATKHFGASVRALVTYVRLGDAQEPQSLDAVEPWPESDFLGSMRAAREALTAEGITINAAEWLRELNA